MTDNRQDQPENAIGKSMAIAWPVIITGNSSTCAADGIVKRTLWTLSGQSRPNTGRWG